METNSSTSSSKELKRFALRFLLPVSLVLAGLCLLADWLVTEFVVFKNESSGAYKVHRMFEELHPEEIPVLGSSRAAGSYVPEHIHPQCFNYGIEKTQYGLTSILLAEELKKDKTTPIIINFDYNFFTDWFGNIAHFIPNLDQAPIRQYVDSNYRAFYDLPALRYYGVYDDYYKTWLGERSSKTHSSRGGFFVKETLAAADIAKRKKTRSGWAIKPQQDADWKALMESTKRPIIIVVAPYHDSYFERFTNLPEGQSYLAELNALPNVSVLDMGRVNYDDDHFMNTTHLNYRGAEAFSTALGEKLREYGY